MMITNEIKKKIHLLFNQVVYEKGLSLLLLTWKSQNLIYSDKGEKKKILIPVVLINNFNEDKVKDYLIKMIE